MAVRFSCHSEFSADMMRFCVFPQVRDQLVPRGPRLIRVKLCGAVGPSEDAGLDLELMQEHRHQSSSRRERLFCRPSSQPSAE